MSKPKISVIVPSFNQGHFIENTIKSILSQGLDNVEIIVIDGGSTDDTLSILKKYEKKISYVSEKDKGQTDAIIRGIKKSKGEIITWLNSDDEFADDALKKILDTFERDKSDIVYGKCDYIDENNKKIGEYPVQKFDYEKLATTNFIAQPSLLFSKELYEKSQGIDETLNYVMDFDLWLKMTKNAKISYIDETLSLYRLHDDSKTVSIKHTKNNHKEALMITKKYFDWAPLSRVYVYIKSLLDEKNILPRPINNLFSLPLSIMITPFYYIYLNNGIDLRDIKLLTMKNIIRVLKGTKGYN